MKPVDLLLHLEAYIALESALGFSLRARESLLRDFVAFVEASAIRELISAQIALDWLVRPLSIAESVEKRRA